MCGCWVLGARYTLLTRNRFKNEIVWCVCLHLFLSSLFLSSSLCVCECIVVPVSNGTFVHTKSIQTPTKANLFSSQDIFIAFSFRCLSRVFLLPDPFRVYLTSVSTQFNSQQWINHNTIKLNQLPWYITIYKTLLFGAASGRENFCAVQQCKKWQ